MAKLRLIFEKKGRASYISHLDLLRTFQRVFLREGLILQHSQGFHPHPLISFALPLSVGQTSDCEVLDFAITAEMDGSDLPERLNRGLPEGIRAIRCYPAEKPVRDLTALKCRVELLYDNGVPSGGAEAICQLLSRDSLIISKRTKHQKMTQVDIRPMLLSYELTEQPDRLTLLVQVAAQNPGLNPAYLATAIQTHLPELTPDFVRVHRLAMLDGQGESFT